MTKVFQSCCLLFLILLVVLLESTPLAMGEDITQDPLFPLYMETRFGELLEKHRAAKHKPWGNRFDGNEFLGTNEIMRMTSAKCPAGGGVCDIKYKRVDPQVPEL